MSTSLLLTQKKTISSTIKKTTECRYSFYEDMLHHDGIFWDNELNAWLVFKYDLIETYLKDKRFKANRKGDFVRNLNTSEYNKEVLSSFYSNWLMYMDPPNHGELRKKVQIPLNKITKNVSAIAKEAANHLTNNAFSNNKQEIDVDKELALPFVVKVLSDILGLTEDDYIKVLTEATNAVDFLWKTNPTQLEIIKTVDSINNTFGIINDIIENKKYQPNKLLDLMIKDIGHRNEILALLVNVTVDGHEPFLSSIKSLIYYYLKYTKINKESFDKSKLVNEVLRLECPFPYCARNATENIEVGDQTISEGERVIFLISAGNRDMRHFSNTKDKTPKILTFGNGTHYCMGGILTMKSLEEFIGIFSEAIIDKEITIKKCNWRDSFGYRTITDLILSKVN